MELAYDHGFTYEATGLPIIMADGLLGDEEVEVPIDGQHYKSVKLATLIVKSQALVVVSHFTGHLAAGFGATIKNLGMGCSSRKGKMLQHSTAKPSIRKKKCTACGECVKWCPADAITLQDNIAVIDRKKCIGCGECLAVCRFDAVGYNWSQTYEHLQEKTLEHAMGVVNSKKDKIVYLNFLTRVSRDCDCMNTFEQIVPDIGVVIGFDPVAVDMTWWKKPPANPWPPFPTTFPTRSKSNTPKNWVSATPTTNSSKSEPNKSRKLGLQSHF